MKLYVLNNDKIIMYNIILLLIFGYNKLMVIWINVRRNIILIFVLEF